MVSARQMELLIQHLSFGACTQTLCRFIAVSGGDQAMRAVLLMSVCIATIPKHMWDRRSRRGSEPVIVSTKKRRLGDCMVHTDQLS